MVPLLPAFGLGVLAALGQAPLGLWPLALLGFGACRGPRLRPLA